jgi:flavin-dependent dehydrogenase
MVKRIAIAGAGSGGLLLARDLAKLGMDVTVFEARDKDAFTDRYHWSDAVYINVLRDAGLPVPVPDGGYWRGYGVIGENSGLDLYEPSRTNAHAIFSYDYELSTAAAVNLPGVLTDRGALLQYLTAQALEAGARIRFGAKAVGLLGNTRGRLGDIDIQGLVIQSAEKKEEIPADLVVDASGGQNYPLRCLLEPPEIGFPLGGNGSHEVFRSIRKIASLNPDPIKADKEHPPIRHHTRQAHKDWVFWAHTLSDDRIDIAAGSSSREAARGLVEEYMSRVPGIGEEVGYAREPYFRGLPSDALVATGFMVVGHSAFQVCPANGCGISQAFTAALIAARVLARARRFDIASLWEYAHRWMSTIGAHHMGLIGRVRGLSADDVKFLIRHGILNGENITTDALEVCIPGKTLDNRELRAAWAENPDLVESWLKADASSRRLLEHYRAYPSAWDPFDWIRWLMFSPAPAIQAAARKAMEAARAQAAAQHKEGGR